MYTAQGTLDTERLVEQYTPLVRRAAYHLLARLPANVQVDDLLQNGMLGLLDALKRYGENNSGNFESYVMQRVRGAMLDGLRGDDWAPRSVRKEMRRLEGVMQRLEHELGAPPTETEMAAALEISLEEYQKLLLEARGSQIVHLDDMGGGDDFLDHHEGANAAAGDPLALLEQRGVQEALAAAIERLPEREKVMMALYYEHDLNLREIGEVMGVTESRVCQLHGQAVMRLRLVLHAGDQPLSGRRGRKRKTTQEG